MKKSVLIIALALILGGSAYWYGKQGQEKPSFPATSSAGMIGNFQKSELIRIASGNISGKPTLFVDGAATEWDKEPSLSGVSPEWIVSHEPRITYANGTYAVNWFFIPGCEEDKKSRNVPNWSKNGLPCLGGYIVNTVINPDGTVNRTEFSALD